MAPSSRPAVYRATGIKRPLTEQELVTALEKLFSEDGTIQIQAMISPGCYSHDVIDVALVTFLPKAPTSLEEMIRNRDSVLIDTEKGQLLFDRNFHGLTQLYPTTKGVAVTADIVAVTGLDGHAYGSWRSRESGKMWLRDFLSESFPTCRTMIYGYDSKLGSTVGMHRILDYKRAFIEDLKMTRRLTESTDRPLIFICHSFGGIIVAQTLVSAARAEKFADPTQYAIFTATRGIMFFGTPHRGLLTEDILSMVDRNEQPERTRLVESIDTSSQELRTELEGFIGIAAVGKFKVFSFYETKKSRKLVKGPSGGFSRSGDWFFPVANDSALLDLPGDSEVAIPVHEDHSNIVKFSSPQDSTFEIVRHHISEVSAGL